MEKSLFIIYYLKNVKEDVMSDFMLIGILIFAICFIVVAITALKIHAFLALSLASILVAVLSGPTTRYRWHN